MKKSEDDEEEKDMEKAAQAEDELQRNDGNMAYERDEV